MLPTLKILLLFFAAQISLAQSPDENRDKYWAYRHRLTGKDGSGGFLSLGTAAGESLPASERHWGRSCQYDWHLLDAKCPVTTGSGLMKWSDCTVHLGYYIAVLALEHSFLQRNNVSADSTCQELWFALHALHRLDSVAETFLGLPPLVNGFFIRDDVPADFYLDVQNKPRFTTLNPDVYCRCIISSAGCGNPMPANGSFTSQDQSIALLMGLAMVVELVPDAVYQGEKLKDKAQFLAHHLVHFLQQNHWKVKPPTGEKIPNRWGGNAQGFSWALAQAGGRICGQRFQKSYHTGFSRTFGRAAWGAVAVFFPFFKGHNASMAFQCAMLSKRWRSNAFARRSLRTDQIVYALADAVLNEKKLGKKLQKADFDALLNAAPLSGTCFGTPDCQAPDGWKSFDRWWRVAHKNGNPYGVHADFPGIDYMFLYALYNHYFVKVVSY